MTRSALFVLFATAVVIGACIDFGAFTCEDDDDCTLEGREGACQPDGACSYPDDECDSGLRVDPHASGDLRGQCVPVEVTCESYCERFPTVCSVDWNPYPDPDACMAQCRQWPTGTADDRDIDSLGCRLRHLSLRADNWNEPFNCVTAGPSGGGACRSADAPSCELYCQVFLSVCEPSFGPFYGSPEECGARCSGLYPGVYESDRQDSVGCRHIHAAAAGSEDPDLTPQDRASLCQAAGPSGGGVCVVSPG